MIALPAVTTPSLASNPEVTETAPSLPRIGAPPAVRAGAAFKSARPAASPVTSPSLAVSPMLPPNAVIVPARICVELVAVAKPLPPILSPTRAIRTRNSSPTVASDPPCLVNVSEPPSCAVSTASVPVLAVIVAPPVVEVRVSATSAAAPRFSVVPNAMSPSCAAAAMLPEIAVAAVRSVLPKPVSKDSGAPPASIVTSGIAAVGWPVSTTVRSPVPLSSPM